MSFRTWAKAVVKAKEDLKDPLTWYLILLKEVRYYIWTLTLCRIGHKPKMDQRTKTHTVAAELRCERCKKVLDFQISILTRETT